MWRYRTLILGLGLSLFCLSFSLVKPSGEDLKLIKVISGSITPKSIVHSGRGLFFAQNMMYRHSVTVYNRNFQLVKTINDRVRLSDFNELGYSGYHRGAPVEVSFSPDHRFAYISNYQMYGQGFNAPGSDDCDREATLDHSYLYRVNMDGFEIDQVIRVGSVPKFLSATPDGKLVLTTNWCSGDLSVVDTELGVEVHRIGLGDYPRGIAIDAKSRYAYVTVMGEDRLAVIRLSDYSIRWINQVGSKPRHVCLDPSGRYLYLTLSREGSVAKLDLVKEEVVAKVNTGKEPRTMVLTPDGSYLYVVNYESNTLSKIATHNMEEVSRLPTRPKPIGVTFDPISHRIWVACYGGSIMIFEDLRYVNPDQQKELLGTGTSTPASVPGRSLTTVPGAVQEKPSELYYIQKDEASQEAPVQMTTRERNIPAKPPIQPKKAGPASTSGKQPPPPSQPSPATKLSYFVIVGSYAHHSAAQNVVDDLQRKGYPAKVLPNGQGRFRVGCQGFSTLKEARQNIGAIKAKLNGPAWILNIQTGQPAQ